MWERACSRKRCVSQHMYQLTHRFREQVESSHRRSHIWFCVWLWISAAICYPAPLKVRRECSQPTAQTPPW
ncbi:hypothetical protein DYL59_06160 [Pseudomonas kairouanensis]|uniref:Uncharacterized protein n=1 Tax=Pseudomonas kairouanensis TaxID=2293832 RepID=A0A4Z0AXL1_9PSED|nr:hypothetical protein DYL59_06160 [Pseudomonas kairouanensis]